MSHSSNVRFLHMTQKYITDDILINLGYKYCFHHAWVQMLSRMGPLLHFCLIQACRNWQDLNKNHFETRIGCHWSLVTMFDHKKEAMEFAINFTILEVAMLSDYVKCIS